MPWSDYITAPTSYRLRLDRAAGLVDRGQYALTDASAPFKSFVDASASTGPDFGHLTLLVFEAVLEVVCVALPGYIVARQGIFDSEAQKFVARLNVMLFTPCLVFTKLASQLTAEKLAELAIIPLIFAIQTLISFSSSWILSTVLRLKKRQKNFVIAMGVFGNSNSLPMSLIISLSKTLEGLHWAKIPGDNDNDVAARGILYLLIFQQLGQLLRWTWGYNVLLAPADRFTEEDGGTARSLSVERGRDGYRDDPRESASQRLLSPLGSDEYDSNFDDDDTRVANSPNTTRAKSPLGSYKRSLSRRSSDDRLPDPPELMPTPANGNIAPHLSRSSKKECANRYDEQAGGVKGFVNKVGNRVHSAASTTFHALPLFLQRSLRSVGGSLRRFLLGLWEFMNPPLWAMLVAIVIASVPQLQHLFFSNGSFIKNSVSRAIEQNGNVAVPLILVVLGGNLARTTDSKGDRPGEDEVDPSTERKILIAALICRLVIPTLLITPILFVIAKYVAVSILDDKIFIIVCFLLSGAPTALQLAQICQINNVYMGVMGRILFQSYVIWILPSTLVLVMLALETVKFAQPN